MTTSTDRARALVTAWLDVLDNQTWHALGYDGEKALITAIADALRTVEAEVREQCATLVDDYADKCSRRVSHMEMVPTIGAIAAAIREAKP